ncbi:MAG TPA: biopolymer transporter ExbD [Chromatiales bacterium]|nr:biopolymer transporter ExbD [Chromatiales bacterium]
MQMSKRARRMERRNNKGRAGAALNLVSLMDIFTILVFFLLVNSSDVEVLPNARDIQLPESVAEEKARENVVVLVTEKQILVQGRPVAQVADVVSGDGMLIPALRDALRAQTDRVLRKSADQDIAAREVTIMGDRELPYRLLKRVMATCTAADYGRISLAVMQRAPVRQAATAGPALQEG